MAGREHSRKVKCPHCGWIRTIPVASLEDMGETHVMRGMTENLKNLGARIKAALADSSQDDANAWIDLPACPHCQKPYQYSVQTGERR